MLNKNKTIIIAIVIITVIFVAAGFAYLYFKDNGNNTSQNKETEFSFQSNKYSILKNKKLSITPASLHVSKDGKRVFVYSQKGSVVALDDQLNVLWEKKFDNIELFNINASNNGARLLLTGEKVTVSGEKEIHQGKILFIDEKGNIIWKKEVASGQSALYSARVSEDGSKIFAFSTPFNPEQKDEKNSQVAIYNEKGSEIFIQDYDSEINFADISADFSKVLVHQIFTSEKDEKAPSGETVGYENNKEVFRNKFTEAGTAKFIDDNLYCQTTQDEASVYNWSSKKPLWQKKVGFISNIGISAKDILFSTYSQAQENEKMLFVSEFRLFSTEGKKKWETTIKKKTDYQPVFSDNKPVALISSDSTEPSLLYEELSSKVLPQKLPAKTTSASFFSDGYKIATSTSDGYVKVLKLRK